VLWVRRLRGRLKVGWCKLIVPECSVADLSGGKVGRWSGSAVDWGREASG
jgi:hypothetical protein